jgi:hypothetical protein
MAVNFGILSQAPTIGARFMEGQQAAAAEQERNMLRQMQAEQMAAQRENRLADREIRAAEEARRAQTFQLDREIKTLDLASRSLFAATPETYPSIRAYLSNLNPQFGAGLPEVYDEAAVKSLARQGMSLKDQIEAASGKPKYMSTPYGPFDPGTGEFKMPASLPSRAPAPGAAPTPATPKPPVGYRFTDGGNLEPIPGGPAARRAAGPAAAPGAPAAKPPTAAQVAKAEGQAQARQALSQDLRTVKGYYEKLAELGAMTSPQRTVAENVLASARATGVGQEVERATATQAQTLRDNISNSRQRLLVHIKNATGASAQQMNSNVELQTWLNALTNPRQSIETVRETLGQLDSVIASVNSQVARESGKKAPATQGRDLGGGFQILD